MTGDAVWRQRWERTAFYLTCGSVVGVFVSIAVCHILLALSVITLLVSGAKLRLPPVKLPLAAFAALTIVSLALAADPAAGRPQIRKFFVFLVLLTVSSVVGKLIAVRGVVMAWIGVAALSAVWSLVQFWQRIEQARQLGVSFYDYYIGQRITGFMSHWMTYSGQMMIALLFVGAFLFFSPAARRYWWVGLACAVKLAGVPLVFIALVPCPIGPSSALGLLATTALSVHE